MAKAKKINFKIISIILAALLVACVAAAALFLKPVYKPSFAVTGDVEHSLKIESFDGYDTYKVKRDGKTYKGILLADLVAAAVPYTINSTVIIRGDDGLLAQVEADKLTGMHIVYTSQFGWEMINEYHPPTSNIKRIAEIWVVADEEVKEHAVNIISADTDIASYTSGQLFMSAASFEPKFHGQSETSGENGAFQVAVYTERRYKSVIEIAPDADDVLVMGEEGQYAYDASAGEIELSGNTLSYVFSDGKTTMEDVRGILISPPSASNMDAYHEAVNYLGADQSVMVILIDGFGYHQYTYAVLNDIIPFISGLPEAKKATTVYKPVTYCGLSAMLTGQPPEVNGVYERGISELNVPDIFMHSVCEGKTCAYIEGNVNIINTSLKPALNADRDGDNSTDKEVFESAKKASGADFIFVHFHGVDDFGHNYGDINKKTMSKLKEIDAYIAELVAVFDGRVIITTDHGMHQTHDGGDHGVFCHKDMIIPYISFDSEGSQRR